MPEEAEEKVNIQDLPAGRYAATRCPDGRYVIVPYDSPLAPVIRRLNKARAGARAAGLAAPDDPAAWARVTAWLDEREPPAEAG